MESQDWRDWPGATDLVRDLSEDWKKETQRLGRAVPGLMFLIYLRRMSRFGYFSFGPITIDVELIEELVERESAISPPLTGGPGISEEDQLFSVKLMEEFRKSGRRRLDELHFLLAFMRLGAGLPGRVFSELGVTPEQVEEYARTRRMSQPELERLFSPEQAAEYLNVHVQTVRAWIRSGRLPARRLAGQRALRIKASDLERVLEPVDTAEAD
jgi:excisionase family DNA binding protein